MRLSQLAREVSKTSRELIDFFQSRGIKNYKSSNSKIKPDHVRLILDHFKPNTISYPDQVDTVKKENLEKEPDEDSESPLGKRKITAGSTKIQPESTEPEIIRAPKMKLQGVKVVGKIELPEKPVKTAVTKDTNENSGNHPQSKKEVEGFSKFHTPHKKKHSKNVQNNRSLQYLQKQKKEERKREKEKRELLRKEKERKRTHYQKKVQAKIQLVQSKKKYRSINNRNQEQDQPELTPFYKNPLRRFWAWLNGAYDEEI